MPSTRQTNAKLSQRVADLESLPQPVVAYGRELHRGEVLPFHRHRRGQFVYASAGVMSVTTKRVSFLVPPQRAVWMPSQMDHRIEARSHVSMRTLYLESEAMDGLSTEPCLFQVTPLLRELIVTAVQQGPVCPPESPQARVASVILDQIRELQTLPLALPMPRDTRLVRITRVLMENPADRRSLAAWSIEAGASKRTLNRLFQSETGMTFQSWRQQCRLQRGVELLATGVSVTNAAVESGYESASAFIAMFRRTLGTTPSSYLSNRSSVLHYTVSRLA